ncbi:MAG: EVE domain-containing protein [Leifsonia sp.]
MAIRYWLGVVQRENVLRGVARGFAQTNHGARGLLERMRESDGLVYYSPRTQVDGEPLKQFTAIGRIVDSEVFQAADSGYRPWRRRVDYDHAAVATSIRPLLPVLDLSRGNPDWGYQLRRGLLEITKHDFEEIRRQMRRPSADDRRR